LKLAGELFTHLDSSATDSMELVRALTHMTCDTSYQCPSEFVHARFGLGSDVRTKVWSFSKVWIEHHNFVSRAAVSVPRLVPPSRRPQLRPPPPARTHSPRLSWQVAGAPRCASRCCCLLPSWCLVHLGCLLPLSPPHPQRPWTPPIQAGAPFGPRRRGARRRPLRLGQTRRPGSLGSQAPAPRRPNPRGHLVRPSADRVQRQGHLLALWMGLSTQPVSFRSFATN